MNLLGWLLFPFTILYQLITDFRNHLYNIGYKKSFEFEANVISVGNLSVGGTGKTPMVEYLIRLLIPDHKIATLSRGYGRKSRGFVWANDKHSTRDIGDEPMQYFLKYGDRITVNVGEERAWAIPNILMNDENTDVILLDDAFQHRTVTPSLSILVTTYDRPFYSDWLMPSGRLRERRGGVKRAEVVVISKCPSTVSDEKIKRVTAAVKKYGENVEVFFTRIKYGKPMHYFSKEILANGSRIMLVTGIANTKNLLNYVEQNFELAGHMKYGDHYNFKSADCKRIKSNIDLSQGVSILTTEKDFAKLREFRDDWGDLPIYYIPIEIEFLDNKDKFDQLILGSIKKYDRQGESTGE